MKIGLRIIKTSFAIFLSTMIYLILKIINEDLSSWFSPFFCAIAAAFSIQPGRNITLQMGKRRMVGSLIGGSIGMLVVFLTSTLKNGSIIELFGYYCIVSLLVIFIIPLTLKLKQKDAVFVTVLTYCSITLGVYFIPQFQYGINRIFSTLTGILIACLISAYRFPKKIRHNKIFTVAINTLLEDGLIDSRIKYKLNYLHDYDCDIIFTSHYSEAELDDILKDINIKNDILVLNGAALYNNKKKTYSNVVSFSIKEKNDIDNILDANNIFALRYVITDYFNKLNIFYNKKLPTHYIEIDDRLEYDYTNANVLDETLVSQYQIIDSLDNINKVKSLFSKYHCTIRKYDHIYYSLYINSNNVSKQEQINNLNINNKDIISFVYKDDALINIAKEVYCVKNSTDNIKDKSIAVLEDSNKVLNKIKNLYFKR